MVDLCMRPTGVPHPLEENEKRNRTAVAKELSSTRKLVIASNKRKTAADEKAVKKTFITALLSADLAAYRLEEIRAKKLAKTASDEIKRSKAIALERAECLVAGMDVVDYYEQEDNDDGREYKEL